MTEPPVDAIIQARLGSTRLPRKVLTPIGPRMLIEHVLGRVLAVKRIRQVIVATTLEPEDDELAAFCRGAGVHCFRGSRDDVLSRLLAAAEACGSDRFIRICGDNPFLDSAGLDAVAQRLVAAPACDYCTYVTDDDVPIILKPIGVFGEGTTLPCLREAARLAKLPKHREHATMFIYEHPEIFRIARLPLPPGVDPELRFTVDYPEDVAHCERILAQGGGLDLQSLVNVVRGDPALDRAIRQFAGERIKRY